MKIIDPGHKFELLCIDGKLNQTLQFVKRFDKLNPKKYPGNFTRYPGTTMQDVIHCLLNRCRYVNNQIPCAETEACIGLLQQCLLNLEIRAAKRHGIRLELTSLEQLEMKKLCPKCGHIICEHEHL